VLFSSEIIDATKTRRTIPRATAGAVAYRSRSSADPLVLHDPED
jgi:hypothetical protein